MALAYGGEADAGIAHLREAIRIATELGNGDDLGIALINFGDALMMLGRVEEAHATLEAGLEDVRSMGLALSHGVGLEENMAECELRLGRWPAARTRLERLLDGRIHADLQRLGPPWLPDRARGPGGTLRGRRRA